MEDCFETCAETCDSMLNVCNTVHVTTRFAKRKKCRMNCSCDHDVHNS